MDNLREKKNTTRKEKKLFHVCILTIDCRLCGCDRVPTNLVCRIDEFGCSLK